MGIFDKFKTSTAIDRLSEERLYEQVAQELKAGKKREGIWVKAMAKSGGSLNKAEALYIEFRVQAIKDDNNLASVQSKLKQKAAKQSKLKQKAVEKQVAAKNQPDYILKKVMCVGRLESLGYKVVIRPKREAESSEIFEVFETIPGSSRIFETIEKLCNFSNLAPRTITNKRETKRDWIIFIIIITALFLFFKFGLI
jgi:hypothetical protein